MMNERQRVNELEQLSAYLDGQLNETEQRQIESRLANEPELMATYEGLRNTKLLFSRLRHVRAPRSFALTPEMVKVRKPKQPFFATIRWATSLATILLVVMFGAEFLLGGAFNTKSAMPAEQPVLESMNAADEAALEEDMPQEKAAEPLIIWGAPGSGGGNDIAAGIGGAGDLETYQAASPYEPSGGGGEIVENIPDETPTYTRTMDGAEDGDLILGVNSEQAGEIVSTSETLAKQPSMSWLANLTPLRWAEIGLGAIILTGVILLLVKKRA